MKKFLAGIVLFSSMSSFASHELTVGVKGMVCSFCAQGIEKTLKKHDEVEKVKVNLDEKIVVIKFKEGKDLSNEKVAEVLKNAGYEATFKEEHAH